MNYKRMGIAALLFAVLVLPASASIVSFLMVETGLNGEAAAPRHTSVWEGGLMDVFYDAGHIVTNSPIARMKKKPDRDLSGAIELDFNTAAAGSAEFFILGFLEYKIQAGSAVPSAIILKIISTGNRKVIYEQEFEVGTGKSLNEEYQIAQNAGRIIISHLKDR